MPTNWQIQCLKSRLRSLRLEISRVAKKDHPYSDPDTVYDALKEVIESRYSHFQEAIDNYSVENPKGKRKLQETFVTVSNAAEYIADVFNYADRVDSARIPFEILRALSWVASTLLNEECHAVVRLDPDYNYTIVSCRRKFEENGWSAEWNKIVKKIRSEQKNNTRDNSRPYTLLLLGFPSYHASSILLHAIAAHEFGHEIFYNHETQIWKILSEAVAKVTHKDHPLHMELQEYAITNIKIPGGGGAKDDYQKSIDYVSAQLLDFLKNYWIVEIFSDLFAANLIGPTFIAAFDQIELKLNKVDKTHPSGHLRRTLIKSYLNKHLPHIIEDPVWNDLFNGDKIEYKPSYYDYEFDDDDPLAPLYSIGEEICKLTLDGIADIVKSQKTPLANPFDLSAFLEKTNEAIEHLAPPSISLEKINGTKQDANYFWLLIYAAWHFRLDTKNFKLFADKFGWDLYEAEEILDNLLLHSLESLELRHLWAKRQN